MSDVIDGAEFMAASLHEDDLQAHIVRTARMLGWMVYHTFDSRRSAEGFPDLVMVRDGRLIFAELKSQKGKRRPEQGDWLNELGCFQEALIGFAGLPFVPERNEIPAAVERLCGVYEWRPSDWYSGKIEAVLR